VKNLSHSASLQAGLNNAPSNAGTKQLAYILYKIPGASKYKTFEIPKKSGGTRKICAPMDPLKTLQRRLSKLLYECRAEIEKKAPRRALSHGFRKSHSIFSNAKLHKNRTYVLNLDLQDFFPTFNFGRVRGFFIKDRDFELDEKVATVLAQIACHENSLPQGSPCSPIIADMIAHILDARLAGLAKAHKVTYSRYADDLTFSTSQKIFPAALASRANEAESLWELGEDLTRTVEGCGFIVNPAKTRMQVRTSRQLVTGLTVNTKVNIRQEYYRYARSMRNALFQTGVYHRRTPVIADGEPGKMQSFKSVESLRPLEGVLSHIHHVKSRSDQRNKTEKKDTPTPSSKLYAKFLFYKYFVAPEKPLIVCEGKTDNIYLKYALRHLTAFHPCLGEMTPHRFKSTVSLFNYTNKANQVIELAGGASNLLQFITRYDAALKTYKHRPLGHPIIILIDNDDGTANIFKEFKKKRFGITFNLNTTEPFYHVTHNLYLIKTPEILPEGTSCIESFFSSQLKATVLDGKNFNPDNNFSAATEYGKAAFAERVVVPQAAKIDWTPFTVLLDRIAAVLAHYKCPAALASRATPSVEVSLASVQATAASRKAN
jgi:retron-type reverse transcriptase